MCFGKSDDSSSRAMVQMQKDEAAEARNKETQRQARLTGGLGNIKALFHGGQTKKTDSGRFEFGGPEAGATGGGAVKGLPKGFTYAHTAGRAGTAGQAAQPAIAAMQRRQQSKMRSGGGNPNSMNYQGGTTNEDNWGYHAGGGNAGRATSYGGSSGSAAIAATPGRAEKWQIRGPDGKLYDVGANVDYINEDVVSDETGITDEFYNKFKQGILDYYNPQVRQKYGDARDELTYNLARAGQLRSDTAASENAKLIAQNDLRTGEVRSKADFAAGDLKTRASDEEAKATAQLYATENPEVAANQATSAIRNITSETPDLTPLGAIFDVASIGGANFMKGSQNADFMKRIGALPKAGAADRVV